MTLSISRESTLLRAMLTITRGTHGHRRIYLPSVCKGCLLLVSKPHQKSMWRGIPFLLSANSYMAKWFSQWNQNYKSCDDALHRLHWWAAAFFSSFINTLRITFIYLTGLLWDIITFVRNPNHRWKILTASPSTISVMFFFIIREKASK